MSAGVDAAMGAAGKPVEHYLNAVNYQVPADYVPSAFALSYVNFIKLVNGVQGEEHKTPLMHFFMLDTLINGDKRIANLCHRGSAKTTLFAEYLILYIAVHNELPGFGEVDLMLYVSDSIENGVKNLRKNVEFRYENSEFLQQFVPHAKFTDVRHEFKNVDGKLLIVKGYGAQTGVRGAKELGKRPQLAVLDDLVSDEDARSATVISSIEDTIYKAVEYALHPQHNMMIWSGTPFNSRDPLYKAVESGAWSVNVFPVCEKFPCTRDEFSGSWPDRFDYDSVLSNYTKQKQLGRVDTFNQELMLRIMSDDDRLIPDENIQWYERRLITRFPERYHYYITTDFATSVKDAADFSVISVWAYNNRGHWFWVDGICRRQSMDQNINDLFRLAQQYRPMEVGVEVSGQQQGFVAWIQSEMLERNVFFALASDNNSRLPGIRPNTNKLERFNLVVPIIKANRMFFPVELKESPEMVEAIEELRLASPMGFKSKHDDFIDTISQLASIKPWKPGEQSTMSQNAAGIWEPDEPEDDSSSIDSYIV